MAAPFTFVQKLNFDYITDGADIFKQAHYQSQEAGVRRQHTRLAQWISDIFSSQRFREVVGLGEDADFFQCAAGKTLTYGFRFWYFNKKATHATFLHQGSPHWYTKSQGKLGEDPDTEGYPGQISLGINRAVWYLSPEATAKDHRLWELYSCYVVSQIQHGTDKPMGMCCGRD